MNFFFVSVILALVLYIVWRQRGIANFYTSESQESLSSEELEKMVNSLSNQVKDLDKHIKAQKAASAEGFTTVQSHIDPNQLIAHFERQITNRLASDRRQINQLETLARALKMLQQQVHEQSVKQAVSNALQHRIQQVRVQSVPQTQSASRIIRLSI